MNPLVVPTSGFQMDRRFAAVADYLAQAPFQHLFIVDLTNIRWLTGFSGSNGWVVVSKDGCVLVTDGRYGEQAVAEIQAIGSPATVCVGTSRAKMVAHAQAAVGQHDTVGFEPAHISVAEHAALSQAIGAEWQFAEPVIETARRCKDQGELDRMEHASAIADRALAEVTPLLTTEPTEAQFRDALEAAMRVRGADGPSFDTIIAAGANAALPHHRPDRTPIRAGMTVVVDFGALYQGYHSDMTRTFILGDPTPIQDEVYQVVAQAQQAGVQAVRTGVRGQDIDHICRDVITKAGWGEWFSHGTGHGVGLQIHESPWLTQNYDDTLQSQDVVTVEPGVYRRDFGGVRIEDMVVVTTTGCQPFTTTPKDSPCLPLPPMI